MAAATIYHNDSAPDQKVRYSLAQETFDLEGNQGYETDDANVISAAKAHRYLRVELQREQEAPAEEPQTSAPEDNAPAAADNEEYNF